MTDEYIMSGGTTHSDQIKEITMRDVLRASQAPLPPLEEDIKPARCNHWPGQVRCGVCGMDKSKPR